MSTPTRLALNANHLRVLSRTLDVMVDGPADCLNDYELIGISGVRFDEIRNELHEVVALLDEVEA